MLISSLRCPLALLAVLWLLSACTTIGSTMGPTADEVVPPSGTDLIAQADAINKAMANATGVDSIQIAEQGYNTVSNSCEAYFTALIKVDKNIQLTKADLTSWGTAAAVISTLTGATQKVIGGTAALFGLASSLTSNLEQYALATPYPVQTHQLITKALLKYAQDAPPSSMSTPLQAIDAVAGYARLCSFAGISDLAQQALSAGVPINASTTQSIFSSSDRTQYLNNVDALLSKAGSTLADSDYLTLAVMADPTTTSDQFLLLQKTLSAAVDQPAKTAKVNTAVTPNTTGPSDLLKTAATYLSLLSASNSAFTKQVAAKKAAQSAAVPGARAPVPAPVAAFSRPNIQIK